MRHLSILSALIGALWCGGCFWATTKSEGKKMRKDISGLETRMTAQEGATEEKMKKLEEVLDKATKLLARNSADIGTEVEAITREQANLTGIIMEAKRLVDDAEKELAALRADYEQRIKDLEQRMVVVEQRTGGAGGAPAKSAEQMYSDGKAAFAASDWAKAQGEFRNLVVKYPSDAHAAEAQYLRAETHFQLKDYPAAIVEFQKVFDKYPKSEWADDAIYRAGESAELAKSCTEARAYFGLIRQSFPRSPFAKKAVAKDAALKKAARNKSKCQS